MDGTVELICIYILNQRLRARIIDGGVDRRNSMLIDEEYKD